MGKIITGDKSNRSEIFVFNPCPLFNIITKKKKGVCTPILINRTFSNYV